MQEKNKKRRRWPVILLIVVLVAAVGIVILGQAARTALGARNAQLSTVAVTRADMTATVYGSGVLEARDRQTLYAPLTALVDVVFVQAGDQVSQGEPLAKLNGDTLEQAISQKADLIETLDRQIRQSVSTSGSSRITAPVAGRIKLQYAVIGTPVQATMDEWQSLSVLSADGYLMLDIPDQTAQPGRMPGDSVRITSGDLTVTGTIQTIRDGNLRILLPDDEMAVGVTAQVTDLADKLVGSAVVGIHKPVYVTGQVGTIQEIRRQVNDRVSKDTTLFVLSEAAYASAFLDLIDQRSQALAEWQALRDQQADLTILAPIDGIVTQLTLQEKSLVQENQKIAVLEGISAFQIQVMIDELDIATLAVGQSATLTLAAFDYQTFAATVARLSAVGSTSGGVTTYPVLLRVDSQAAFFAGMSASADIVVGQRQQVLTVPLAALKVDGARVYVTRVITNDQGRQTTEDVSVSVGLVDAAKAEITAGLIDGDLIALTQNNTAASPAGFNFGRR